MMMILSISIQTLVVVMDSLFPSLDPGLGPLGSTLADIQHTGTLIVSCPMDSHIPGEAIGFQVSFDPEDLDCIGSPNLGETLNYLGDFDCHDPIESDMV
jgi:hypothetical protein